MSLKGSKVGHLLFPNKASNVVNEKKEMNATWVDRVFPLHLLLFIFLPLDRWIHYP
jgi:hypothetical protein